MTAATPTPPDAVSLLRPIFEQCVILGGTTSTAESLARSAEPLREFLEVAALNQVMKVTVDSGITRQDAVQLLRASAKELADDYGLTSNVADEGMGGEATPSASKKYVYLRFVAAILTEPPSTVPQLAILFDGERRSLSASQSRQQSAAAFQTTIHRWLLRREDEGIPEYVGAACSELIERLVERSTSPEPPVRSVPATPLRSFSDLTILGSLRRTFIKLYGTDHPKPAQADLIPQLLAKLENWLCGDAESGRVCLVAPTNSGKNGMILCAALAAVAWGKGPAIVLQPHRVQIQESLTDWTDAAARRSIPTGAGSRGLTVAGSSGLISDHDRYISRRQRDIVSIIPEKLAVLCRNRPIQELCTFLVLDELALLFERQRGPKLEILLTLARSAGLPIMVAGAAVPPEAARRAALWLGEEAFDTATPPRALVFDPSIQREPPLEYLVWRRDGARVYWKSKTSGLERLPPLPISKGREAGVAEVVSHELADRPGSKVLVFVESRERVMRIAKEIANDLPPPDSRELEEARQRICPRDVHIAGVSVADLASRGVAVHSRDVPKQILARIEKAFRAGDLDVMVATTTVEAGINLPVDTVIQVGLDDHHHQGPIRNAALEQRLGRAGRTVPGRGSDISGRGIIYVPDPSNNIDSIIPQKLLTPDNIIDSQMTEQHLALLLLVGLRSGPRSEADLKSIINHSFWALSHEAETDSATSQALTMLRSESLVEDIQGTVIATPLGRAIAAGMLLPSDASALARVVRVAEDGLERRRVEWMADVLLATCLVPSVQTITHSPRVSDVHKTRESVDAVFKRWALARGGQLGFGDQRVGHMPISGAMVDLFEKVRDGRAGNADLLALLRTYVAFVWTLGRDLSAFASVVDGVTEHGMEQDIAYHLAHVIRSAGWAAEHEGKYHLAYDLERLSLEVANGLPARALPTWTEFRGYVDRPSASKVTTKDGLPPGVLSAVPEADLIAGEENIERRHHQRGVSWRELAAEHVLLRDAIHLVDRIDTIHDVLELVGIACALDSPPAMEVIDDTTAAPWGVRVTLLNDESDIWEVSGGTSDLVFVNAELSPILSATDEPCHVSVIGRNEFTSLLRELAEGASGNDLMHALAESQRFCRAEFVAALGAELRSQARGELVLLDS